MSDQLPNQNPVTNPIMDYFELQSTSSPVTNVTELLDSEFLFSETPPSTYIGLPEVSNFSTFVQPLPDVQNLLEQFTTNVVLQPQRGMEVGESSRRRPPRRRLEFDRQVAQGREGNSTRSQQEARLHHIQRNRMHCQSERARRERIRQKIKTLKELVPECDKSATVEVLDAATNHIRGMQTHLSIVSMGPLLRNMQMGSYCGMGWPPPPLGLSMIPPQPPLGLSMIPPPPQSLPMIPPPQSLPMIPPPQSLPMIPQQPTFGNLPLPQADATMMAATATMFQQTTYRPPQLPMHFNPSGLLTPPPQPSRFLNHALPLPLPPRVYTSVAPSVFVPPNFPSSTNTSQDGLNQRNPDDTNDDPHHF